MPNISTTGLDPMSIENINRTQGKYGAVNINSPKKLNCTYGCLRLQTYTFFLLKY